MTNFEKAIAELDDFMYQLQEKYKLSDQEVADVLDIVLGEMKR